MSSRFGSLDHTAIYIVAQNLGPVKLPQLTRLSLVAAVPHHK